MPIASTKAPKEPISAAPAVLHALAGAAVRTLQPLSLCISSHHAAGDGSNAEHSPFPTS